METAITYTNNRGVSLTFGGDDERLHYLDNSVHDYEWSYNSYNGRITSFYKPIQEIDFAVGIASTREDDGIELRNKLYEMTEQDIIDQRPGTLTFGDWSMRCYCIASDKSAYHYSGRFMEASLKLITDEPYWTREKTYTFAAKIDGTEGTDMPLDYEHDYNYTIRSKVINNEGFGACDVTLRISGPAELPAITIAGNTYKLNIELEDSESAIINTHDKTVQHIKADGSVVNAFAEREHGAKGSGSYIFERVPQGLCELTWGGSFDLRVVLSEQRSEAPWK